MRTTKYILGMVLSAAFLFTGCMKDDIDELRRLQAENADRIAALEVWQQTVNSNIGTLQQLVSTLENNDYVTGVVPFTTPAPGGYKITFTKSPEATIWNGAKGDKGEMGATGHSPVIGVAEFPAGSGAYYWTLDGEFIKSAGEKTPTTGNTPKVAIGSDGFWYISTDGSATGTPDSGTGWTPTGVKATGEDGPQGSQGEQGAQGEQGDAVFAKNGINTTHPDYVVFTLTDGTTITLPKYKSIGIKFNQPWPFSAGETKDIPFESIGSTVPTQIRAVDVSGGWKVTIDMTASVFKVTAPAIFTDENNDNEVTVLVADGDRIAAMYALMLSNTGVTKDEIGAIYYEKGVPMGVVCNANMRLILHKDCSPLLKWANDEPAVNTQEWQWDQEKLYGDYTSLEAMEVFKATGGDLWKERYPAAAWCHSKGEGWFLPNIKEFVTYIANKSIVNATLLTIGGTIVESVGFWTCKDFSSDQAMRHAPKAPTASSTLKNEEAYVRAIKHY